MSDAITLPAPDLQPAERVYAEWEDEHRAFIRLLPALLTTHRGQYVAVHHGKVIAEGTDQVDVARRAYESMGYVPVYVGLVADLPAPPVRIPSPRLLDRRVQ